MLFSDLIDGPTSGWEESSTRGAAVSVWGAHFGSTRGTSTITACGVTLSADSDYAEWGATTNPTSARGLERITFWLNSTMTAGPSEISVTTSMGRSGTVPFHCRDLGSNHIYFISTGGSDTNDGLYSGTGSGSNGPWSSAKTVRDLQPGDVAYFRQGIWTGLDDWDAIIDFWANNHQNGAEGHTISIASYPAELAQLGDGSNKYTIGHHGSAGDDLVGWTFSKFNLRAFTAVTHWATGNDPISDDHLRFIANDMSTSSGGKTIFSTTGGLGGETNLSFYGNYLHDAGADSRSEVAPERAYGLYLAGYGHHEHVDIGWNEIAYNSHGRGIQVYAHTVTDWIDDVRIHDNYIHDNGMTGAVLGGGDGGAGRTRPRPDPGVPGSTDYTWVRTLYFYNNIVANNGDNTAEGNHYPAILVQGSGFGALGGKYYIYNNTFYNNVGGEWDIHDVSGHGPESVDLNNNIVYTTNSPYFGRGERCGVCTASNDLYYGQGPGPSWDTNRLDETDPLFLADLPSTYLEFSPQDVSPTIDVGVGIDLVTHDFMGVARPVDGTNDIGPFEYVAAP